jgi:hypothetical protein
VPIDATIRTATPRIGAFMVNAAMKLWMLISQPPNQICVQKVVTRLSQGLQGGLKFALVAPFFIFPPSA